jgi:hypothetical protein
MHSTSVPIHEKPAARGKTERIGVSFVLLLGLIPFP